MVRGYALSFDWRDPMGFAQAYYHHYPRVALGHWPPVFYAVQTLWTLPFSPSRLSILAFMAFQTALCGTLAYLFWRERTGHVAAFGIGAVFLLTTTVQWLTAHVMAEMLVLVWMLLAMWAFAAYVRSERWRDSVLFGCFAAAAIMTKANGFALALLPPMAVLLSRKLHLSFRPSFWAPAGIVVAICLPWYALTINAAKDGWTGSTDPQFLLKSVARANLESLYSELGIALLFTAVAGLYSSTLKPVWAGRPVHPVWAVSAAAIVSVLVFHTFITPVREARHLSYAIPAILAFSACGIRYLASWLWPVGRKTGLAAASIAAIVLAAFVAQCFRITEKPSMGAADLAALLASGPYANKQILAASPDARGEGAVIAEMAMRQPLPLRRVIRASKALASTSWDGGRYQVLAEDTSQVMAILAAQGAEIVVIEKPGSQTGPPHYVRVLEAIQERPELFARLSFSGSPQDFEIYELRAAR
jgi:4-amino-4-deoxy-L-arabinose transferase-like glycosyltransferase